MLAYRPAWHGVTGDIPFSAVLDDMGEVFLAKYAEGKWTYHSREQLGIPKLTSRRASASRRALISVGLNREFPSV